VLLDEVVKSHPPVNLDHQDLSIGFYWTLSDGSLTWYLDGWVMQLVDKNSWWDISLIGTQFRDHIRSQVVVVNHMMNFQVRELVLELAYFHDIRVHGVFVDIPLFVDLLDHQQGVAINK
jgi:hypothetical protein